MFLKPLLRLRHTLAFRLTLWYAGIFTISSCVAFLFYYMLITAVLREQTDQGLLNQAGTFSSILTVKGTNSLKRVAIREAQAAGERKIFIRLLSRNGEMFSSSNMSYWKNIGIKKSVIKQLVSGENYLFETVTIPERKHKVRVLYKIIGPSVILQLGQSMENHSRFIEAFQKIFLSTMSFLLVLAALIGWFMARQALSGLEEVTRTARHISDGALDERVPVKNRGDEINLLATTFNQMLDRIQGLLTGIKEMSDNIAHDLKSPITGIRGNAEVTLSTATSIDDYRITSAGTIEECDRLLDMINTMLVISETEAGVGKLNFDRVDMAAVVREACVLFQPLAEDKNISLEWDIPDKCYISGDIRMIQRMITNILDNAIKYTEADGAVNISVHADDHESVTVSVQDTGIGISEKDIPHIFERFYKCDRSRSQAGIGLGLSLARTIIQAHGGDIQVNSKMRAGSTFTFFLPKN